MVIRIDYLIYVYMTLCLCMLAYNLFYLGKNKWTQSRTEKQIRTQVRQLKTFLLFPERTSANEVERMKKKLSRTHRLVVLEGTVEELTQNPLTKKPLQDWLPTLKPTFVALIDKYMKKSVMERSYFAYLVMRFGLCGQSPNDPIAAAMIELTAQSSIYCRENALGALYTCGSTGHVVKAYRLMARHEIEHSRKMVTDGLLEFHGEREQLALALWQSWDEFTPHYQVAFLDFFRMVSGNFREKLYPLLQQTEMDHEVTFAIMRYFRKYPYRPAGAALRQFVREWEKRDWEYAAIAAAALDSYPEMDTIQALLIGVQSDNWYVRDNASDSLLQLATSLAILEIILQMQDSYGQDMLRYKAVSAGLVKVDSETGQLVLSGRAALMNEAKEAPQRILAGWQQLAKTELPQQEEEILLPLQEWEDEE